MPTAVEHEAKAQRESRTLALGDAVMPQGVEHFPEHGVMHAWVLLVDAVIPSLVRFSARYREIA
jgi:hypothetical protein